MPHSGKDRDRRESSHHSRSHEESSRRGHHQPRHPDPRHADAGSSDRAQHHHRSRSPGSHHTEASSSDRAHRHQSSRNTNPRRAGGGSSGGGHHRSRPHDDDSRYIEANRSDRADRDTHRSLPSRPRAPIPPPIPAAVPGPGPHGDYAGTYSGYHYPGPYSVAGPGLSRSQLTNKRDQFHLPISVRADADETRPYNPAKQPVIRDNEEWRQHPQYVHRQDNRYVAQDVQICDRTPSTASSASGNMPGLGVDTAMAGHQPVYPRWSAGEMERWERAGRPVSALSGGQQSDRSAMPVSPMTPEPPERE